MKLLICTQAVDQNDPVLGFFTHWIGQLAEQVEHVEVICLREGECVLPANVRVYALGGGGRLARAWRFKMLIWKLRHEYDTVFVHMNPEYMILGGLNWRLWGKRAALWYNHPAHNLRLAIAAHLATIIFYTSPYAATAKMPKARQMPVGIDTGLFKPMPVLRDRHALYMQGRVAPSKRIELALAALRILRERIPATLDIVGPEDVIYANELRARFKDLMDAGAVRFLGPKKNEETPALYSSHGVALNLAASGHFDKTAFEPMACETPVVVTSQAFVGLVPDEWVVPEESASALARAIERLMALPEAEYAALGKAERASVEREHGLASLITQLVAALAQL
jgi:glycosyltransferase involved in cell wall biosynthesis